MAGSVNYSNLHERMRVGRLVFEYHEPVSTEVITVCMNFIRENGSSVDYLERTLERMGEQLLMEITLE